ncbi:putative mediator of RNA polymerase II transcription subunit 26 [Toxorhynchites rutilus septentrionalis]|uniref:putative mediator of RNA polymerase II transcription subunit 26 n=1 Tax=Toxorhynchites rutilus septentrionalis TaxID=329112 RepID=UPI00247870B2|nr:putative mediator of RNA polymerase II transcription subunit 26 [Toxorhynchites rutilus septentrionalis]
MSTTNNTKTNQQGPDAPQASENKPEAEKLPTTTTTVATEGEEQATKQQEVVPAVEPTPQNGTAETKANDDSSADAEKTATETMPDATAPNEESKPEAMDVTSSEETKPNIAASAEAKPVSNKPAAKTAKPGSVAEKKQIRYIKKREKWLLENGYSADEAESISKDPFKFNRLRRQQERTEKDLPKRLSSVQGPPKSVEGGIPMAVASKDHPVTFLTKEQCNTIKSAILKQVVQQKDAAFKPRFEDCVLASGYLLVRCSDHQTRQWLEKIIPTLDLWKDASVKVMSEKKLLNVDEFVGSFTDSLKDSNKEIFDFVECQNDGISTSKWKVVSRKEFTQKQIIELTFIVDAASAKMIHTKGYNLNYKFKKVALSRKIKPVAGSNGGRIANTNANANRVQSNNRVPSNNRGQSNINRAPARRAPREQKPFSSSSFVPIWDSNLPKGGNYMRAPNQQRWSATDQGRGNVGSSSRSNVGSSSRNTNSSSHPYDSGSRNGSYGGRSQGSSSSGGTDAQLSAIRSLNLINSLYDQLRTTVTSSRGNNSSSNPPGSSRSRDNSDRYRSRRGNNNSGGGGGRNSYNSNSGRSSNSQNNRNNFKPSKFF